MSIASLTVVGSFIQKLWFLLRYPVLHLFTRDVILSLSFKIWWTHQLNADLCSMPWAMAYLEPLDCVQLFNIGWLLPWCEAILPFETNVPTSCWLSKCCLAFDHNFLILYIDSWILWSKNDSNKWYSFPSTSHWAYIDSILMIAANSVISPWGNSTS